MSDCKFCIQYRYTTALLRECILKAPRYNKETHTCLDYEPVNYNWAAKKETENESFDDC